MVKNKVGLLDINTWIIGTNKFRSISDAGAYMRVNADVTDRFNVLMGIDDGGIVDIVCQGYFSIDGGFFFIDFLKWAFNQILDTGRMKSVNDPLVVHVSWDAISPYLYVDHYKKPLRHRSRRKHNLQLMSLRSRQRFVLFVDGQIWKYVYHDRSGGNHYYNLEVDDIARHFVNGLSRSVAQIVGVDDLYIMKKSELLGALHGLMIKYPECKPSLDNRYSIDSIGRFLVSDNSEEREYAANIFKIIDFDGKKEYVQKMVDLIDNIKGELEANLKD